MGCCNAVEQVKISPLKSQLVLDSYSKTEASEIIEKLVDSSINSYEKAIMAKITPKRPLNLIEFEKSLKTSLTTELNNFDEQIGKIPETPEIFSIYSKYKIYLMSKCKSREGYFRYLNNLYSFQLIFNIRQEILTDFFDRKTSYEETINRYKKQARGTYVIYGLQKLYDHIKIGNKEEVFKLMDEDAAVVYQTLEDNRVQLERASRKAILPFNVEENSEEEEEDDDKESSIMHLPSREMLSRNNSLNNHGIPNYDEFLSKTSETNLSNQYLGVNI